MPLFFFHYHTPLGVETDETGCDFASLDLAYLDAYRGMIEIGAELLKQQIDPAHHMIEIADADGRMLMDLRFDEVFRPRRLQPASIRKQSLTLRENLRRFRQLREEVASVCAAAQASVDEAHRTLRRANSMT